MEEGDYVRTEWGDIERIVRVDNDNIIVEIEEDKDGRKYSKMCYKEDIIKSSPNIIDVIEVGDYVNGYEVTSKDQFLGFGNHDWYMTNDEIKSIVTKEQFKNMEYEVK